jgi:hypothetical protein
VSHKKQIFFLIKTDLLPMLTKNKHWSDGAPEMAERRRRFGQAGVDLADETELVRGFGPSHGGAHRRASATRLQSDRAAGSGSGRSRGLARMRESLMQGGQGQRGGVVDEEDRRVGLREEARKIAWAQMEGT